MADPTAQLPILRALHDATTDLGQRAALNAAIAALEQATGVRSYSQHIGGYATIAAAIAGDFTGNLYIAGERAQSVAQLLAGYLRWLTSHWGQLPLHGVREQKSATDVLQIGLDQVYTQLATTGLEEREVFEGESLKTFDAEAYLREHVGLQIPPGQQRVEVRIPVPTGDAVQHPSHPATAHADTAFRPAGIAFEELKDHTEKLIHGGKERLNLLLLSHAELTSLATQYRRLTFFGPQLVTEAIAANSRLVLLGEPGSGKSTALRYLTLTLARWPERNL